MFIGTNTIETPNEILIAEIYLLIRMNVKFSCSEILENDDRFVRLSFECWNSIQFPFNRVKISFQSHSRVNHVFL